MPASPKHLEEDGSARIEASVKGEGGRGMSEAGGGKVPDPATQGGRVELHTGVCMSGKRLRAGATRDSLLFIVPARIQRILCVLT